MPPPPGTPPEPGRIAALSKDIAALDPVIDGGEAARAANVAFHTTSSLAVAYQITDPPLIHNTKVNLGLRPRGLCWHWADDMESALAAEGFDSLALHRAIANADNPFRIEHSTVIISARGATMWQGIVLDPWRKGGVLTFVPTGADPDYRWQERDLVFEAKARARARRAGLG
ncbi:hypothetical protein [Oceanibium sediminis]|uniref:hypothetical protein n=1 Tax=Oceanibium sediminis TaxID=2026339 RepID=UPI000DD492CC|nr:hypothetical protein [Oceanibium sediminis]